MNGHEQLDVATDKRCQWVDITRTVQKAVERQRLKSGFCLVSSPHTTAAVPINENADSDVERDFFHKLEKMVPQHEEYRHSEGNSDSHVKSSLIGFSVTVPVSAGRLVLGTWQSIYFCEFDGPRRRKVHVTLVGE